MDKYKQSRANYQFMHVLYTRIIIYMASPSEARKFVKEKKNCSNKLFHLSRSPEISEWTYI